jgi:hypothetical protein
VKTHEAAMLTRLLPILTIVLCLIAPARAAAPLPIDDPDRFSHQIFTLISQAKFHDAATQAANAIGSPERADELEKMLKELEGKKFDFGKKVYDKDYNGALRQIIYYAYVETFGFVYLSFSFKMTSKGWYLGNFFFKEASQELFPKDIIEGPM